MNRERGNISLVLLVVGLFLAALSYLAMVCVSRAVDFEQDYWRGRQLRWLCGSVMETLVQQKLEAGKGVLLEASLHPGNIPAKLNRRVVYSADGHFRHIELRAEAGEASQSLKHILFQLDEEKLAQAQGHMLISGKGLLGTEFLPDGEIYTSAEEVILPQVSFLKNTSEAKMSISDLAMDDVRQYGLVNRFYYLTGTSSPTTFTKNLRVYGTAVIATEGSIIIESGCQFFDRVIFLVRGTLTIKDNVQLPQALAISYGKVTIGAGCKIGGVIFSGSNIDLQGSSELIHDENVVAPFSSAFYIL